MDTILGCRRRTAGDGVIATHAGDPIFHADEPRARGSPMSRRDRHAYAAFSTI